MEKNRDYITERSELTYLVLFRNPQKACKFKKNVLNDVYDIIKRTVLDIIKQIYIYNILEKSLFFPFYFIMVESSDKYTMML